MQSPLRFGSIQQKTQAPPSIRHPSLPEINNTHRIKRGKRSHHHLNPLPALGSNDVGQITHTGMHCGVCTMKGLKPGNPNWQNQDNFIVKEGGGEGVCIYTVFDGHGELGHLVSQRCRDQLPSLLAQADYDLVRGFRFTQQDLLACKDMDVQCSGATCVLALKKGKHLKVKKDERPSHHI